jgi:hypothetical protein
MDDPTLPEQVLPDLLREVEVGGVVAVQVADLAPPDREREFSSLARARLDAGPRRHLLGDAPACCAWLRHECLHRVPA